MHHLSNTKTPFQEFYEFLRDILKNAFRVESYHSKAPFPENNYIHADIEPFLWPNISILESEQVLSSEHNIFVIRSNLELYGILIYLEKDTDLEFINIGPFRSTELTLDAISVKYKELNLTETMQNTLFAYFETLPLVPVPNIVDTIVDLLGKFFPDTFNTTPVFWDYAKPEYCQFEKNDCTPLNIDDLASNAQQQLLEFRDMLLKGERETALQHYKQMLIDLHMFSSDNIYICKRQLHMVNDYLLIILLTTHINPTLVSRIYRFLIEKIERIYNHDTTVQTAYEIFFKYFAACQNTALPEYSKTVNEVIHYIHSHLEEPLNLSVIAKFMNKNASALSSSFKQNTGMTITDYIHQARINKAVQYFNTTKMTVSEAALAVGFQDFAYFSRLFRKQMGCSPKEYRNEHMNV